MLTSKTLLTQILDENIIGAKESVHTLLWHKKPRYIWKTKSGALLQLPTVPCSEANGEGNCGCDEQVEEDCECNEADDLPCCEDEDTEVNEATKRPNYTNDLLDTMERAYKREDSMATSMATKH